MYSKNTNSISQQSQDLFSEKYSPNDSEDNNKGKILILLVISLLLMNLFSIDHVHIYFKIG